MTKDDLIATLKDDYAALRNKVDGDAMTTDNLSTTTTYDQGHARGDDQPPIEYVKGRSLPLAHISSHRHFLRKMNHNTILSSYHRIISYTGITRR